MDRAVAAALVLPGLGTAVGGLALFAFRRPTERTLDALLGFTAGVMLAATVVGLLVPGLRAGPWATVVLGAVGGVALLRALDRWLPHAHARFAERGRAAAEHQATRLQPGLLITAMTIHNLPEGLAVGAAFASGGWEMGLPIALAIGLQNVPEGFAAAAPLMRTGSRPVRAAAVAAATGLVEPPAALAAYGALGVVERLLPLGLGFAAGAMAYVTFDELIPESRAHGHRRAATVAMVVGAAAMIALERWSG